LRCLRFFTSICVLRTDEPLCSGTCIGGVLVDKHVPSWFPIVVVIVVFSTFGAFPILDTIFITPTFGAFPILETFCNSPTF